MSDFTFSREETRREESKSYAESSISKAQLFLILSLAVFIVAFAGIVYLSVSAGGLMLNELLLCGGVLSLMIVGHFRSNK